MFRRLMVGLAILTLVGCSDVGETTKAGFTAVGEGIRVKMITIDDTRCVILDGDFAAAIDCEW